MTTVLPSGDNIVDSDDVVIFESYLRLWQVRLGLQDWRIVLSPIRAKGSMAEMDKWDWPQRQVTCRIGTNWKSSPVTPYTLELTAVHELLHVKLYPLKMLAEKDGSVTDEYIRSIEHAIINTIEPLLVSNVGGS